MLARALACAVVGLDGRLVEVDIASYGLPNFIILGLPDAAVREAREHIRAASRTPGSPSRRGAAT